MAARAQRRGWRFLQPVLCCAVLAILSTASGGMALAQSAIVAARYDDPTTRYAHGVLGDDIEYGALVLELADGNRHRLTLPEVRVFEDIAPRLADLDGDDLPEVITVESHQKRGARLAIYNADGLITATPYIGTANRWLAPIGAADLDGDGWVEIAYIDRPHLAKTLRIWRYEQARLTEVGTLKGLSNHRIGEDFITGGVRRCAGAPPELITASGDWRRIVATGFQNGQPSPRDLGPFEGQASVKAALAC